MSEYKMVVLGSGGVGKSALTIQFIQGNFVERYDPTIEDSYRKHIEVDGRACMLDILDTAGQEEYTAMRDNYMRSGKGFILVYSVTDPSSFEEMVQIYDQLVRSKDNEDIPIVLVGNKCDLEEERSVTLQEGKELASRMGSYCTFIEASAKANIKVFDAFANVVRMVDQSENEEEVAEEETNATQNSGKDKKKKKNKFCLTM